MEDDGLCNAPVQVATTFVYVWLTLANSALRPPLVGREHDNVHEIIIYDSAFYIP